MELVIHNGSVTISDNQWHHIALVYTGSGFYGYVDGSLDFQDTTYTGTLNLNAMWLLGNYSTFHTGLMDEVRVSNIIRYTSNFTPQTSPFVRDEYTKLLLHFDENGEVPYGTSLTYDDSGNGKHGTITGAKYVAGLVGVDVTSSSSQSSVVSSQSYAGHEGIFIEEGTTNFVTNPSFEHSTYNTNWTTNGCGSITKNTTQPYIKFGSSSTKMVASGCDYDAYTSQSYASGNYYTYSIYLYNGTTGNIGGSIPALMRRSFIMEELKVISY